MGAPIGVVPSAMPSRKAITRPRIAGSVDSWIRLFDVFVNVRPATPVSASAAANQK